MYIHQIKIENTNSNNVGDILLQNGLLYIVEALQDSDIIIRNAGYFEVSFLQEIPASEYPRRLMYNSETNKLELCNSMSDCVGYILPLEEPLPVGSLAKVYLNNC